MDETFMAEGYRLFENKPAELFEDAHLLGNGSLGASVFGDPSYEAILINHDTLWSGQEAEKINPGTLENFQEARRLTMGGQLKEANNLINDRMLGYWSESYMPLGWLHLTVGQSGDQRNMPQRRTLLNELDPCRDYRRELALDDAVERITYARGQTAHAREIFASRPDNVLAVRLTAKGGRLDFAMSLSSPLRHEQRLADGEASITGRAPDRVEPYRPYFHPRVVYRADEDSGSVRFACVARVVSTDGAVSRDAMRVYVTGATEAVVLLAAATDYAGYRNRRGRDTEALARECAAIVGAAAAKPYQSLLADHVGDYRGLYGRFFIDLGEPITDALPTSERLERFASVEDPALLAAVAQYSRYLLIASSRPGTQAANLQGIWNESLQPPWASNYTTNINAQMNYWGAEPYNLSECHLPMSDLVRELSDSGRLAAKKMYGMNGWVAHHNADLWRMAGVAGEDASWAWWPFGGFWLAQHLWTHYDYTRDENYLRDVVWPVYKEAAAFLLDFAVKGEDGFYYTAPSTSPENKFFYKDGSIRAVLGEVRSGNRFSASRDDVSAICRASTMDLAIARELLGRLREAAGLLGLEAELDPRLPEVLENLCPFQIGKHGQLQEWDRDYEECTPGMSHVSHLYAVYPSSVISASSSPELFDAARASMQRRMQHGGHNGHWPGAWYASLNARFRDDAACNGLMREMAQGLGANMLVRRVWQIDAIFGWGAAIAEMLLQSHDGAIELLPAIPRSWRRGRVLGMKARGGFTVGMEWADNRLSGAVIESARAAECAVRYRGKEVAISVPAGGKVALDGDLAGDLAGASRPAGQLYSCSIGIPTANCGRTEETSITDSRLW
ncbi:MAG: glycoside hydrolase family 95 protein [Clostridiales bacterium]|jgi:alpha-L-fucosidase 2|nr:glycoside hydrolase family 95 protein [Clostridiales bacterium]